MAGLWSRPLLARHHSRMTAPLLAVLILPPPVVAGTVVAETETATAQTPASPEVVEVRTLSGRADLVTGGGALVEVSLPAGADPAGVRVDVDGRDVTSAFVKRDEALLGLVTGLVDGLNVVTATLPDGSGARLDVTNAPISGPVFAGPQIEPWTCADGDQDDCNEPATVAFHYQSTSPAPGGGLQPYDPNNPPSDVAMTTTDEGNQVPFIVREETGVSLRDEYKIAALFDPDEPVDPTAENPGYSNKLVLTHGASCDTAYEMGTAPDVLLEDALSQGFAVASHALDNSGHNCNLVTEAESLVVTKELVAERFGPIRYTIGTGCSGGSLVQQQVANAYRGVYQGILPQCSFTDAWSSAQQYIDYVGLRAYVEDPANVIESGITPAQYEPIFGHPNQANVISFTTVIPNSGEPTRDCPGVPPEDVYDENDNPDGVRCTLQDYMVNVFGEDENGKARRPIGNTGIQYGLSGLQDGVLLPNQFVALNAGVGGFDLDLNKTTERPAPDPLALERVYRSGAVNTGAHLDDVAIIDMGGPEPGAFHDVYRKYSMRARLLREHGTFANQVFWEGPTPLLGDVNFVDQGIRAMDDWLAAIEADDRDVELSQKVIEAKDEAGIEERCTDGSGNDVELTVCDALVDPTIFSSPRIEAGGGPDAVGEARGEAPDDPNLLGYADDTLECQLMDLEEADYGDGATFADIFTPAQQATLRDTFPTGVCDYSLPSIGAQDAVTWLTYQDADGSVITGGEPLGPPPVSVPFGPGTTACSGAPMSIVTDRSDAREVHRPSIDCVLHLGIAQGTTASTYSPLRDVTREQMATFIVNVFERSGTQVAVPEEDAFTDIASSFHRNNINRLAATGITVGKGDGTFDPSGNLTRAQMPSFLVRAAELAPGQDLTPERTDHFGDVPADSPHERTIAAGFEAGLFNGTVEPTPGEPGSGTYSPGAMVPRDQMATFLVGLFEELSER